MFRILLALALLCAAGRQLFAQTFQIVQSQLEVAVAPGFNHVDLNVPISGTAAGFDFSTVTATSDAAWVTPSVDSATSSVALTFQTAGLTNSLNTATITVSQGGTVDTFFVKAEVGPFNVVKLEDDPVRSRTYGIHQNGLNRGALIVIDPLDKSKKGCVTLGKKPGDLAVSRDGTELLVINCVDETITAIELPSLKVKETIQLTDYDNWGASDTTADIAYGPGSTIYYTDGAWAPALRVFNRTTRQVLQSVLDQTYGIGDFAVAPDQQSLIGWVQYGWSAGVASSYIVRYTVGAQGMLTFSQRTVSNYPNGVVRDPLNAPVLIDSEAKFAFVKVVAVTPTAVSETRRTFPRDVYSISPGGEIAVTNSAIVEMSTGNSLLQLPATTTVQAITSDYSRLVYFNSTTRQVDTIDLFATIGPTVLNRALSPADGSITLAPTKLEWSSVPGVDRYRVYFGTVESEVRAATPASALLLGEVTAPSIALSRVLTAGSQYFWRVDTVSESEVSPGDVHSFTVSRIGTDRSAIATSTVQGHSNHTVAVQLTAESPIAWTASANVGWVTFEQTTGTTPDVLAVQINSTSLAKGTHSATISVKETASGDTAFTIPLTVEVDALKITVMESDPTSGLVYAISEDTAQVGGTRAYLLELDSVAKTIKRVVRAGTSGTDLAVHHREGRVYVANWMPGNLLAFDKATLQLVRTYNFSPFQGMGYGENDVYRIAAGAAGRLLVEEQDQWVDISIFDTNSGTKLKDAFVRQGGGEYSPDGRYYYHGEDNSSGAEVLKFDVTGDVFTELASIRVALHSYYGTRTVVVSEDGNHVFWNGGQFNKDLVLTWGLGKEIYSTTPDGRYAFGKDQIFDTVTKQVAYAMPVSTQVSAFNSTSQRLVVQVGGTVQFYEVGNGPTLTAPVLSVGAVTQTSVALSWTDGLLETGYTLQRRVAGQATWTDVPAGLGANATQYTVTGLTAGTAYEFRIKADTATQSSAWSNVVSATTTPIPVTPPIATTGAAMSLSQSGATLTATVNPNGRSTSVYFQYGLSNSYGSVSITSSAGSGTSAVQISRQISGLAPDTTYHFRVVATNADGTVQGSDATFTTLAPPIMPPVVTTEEIYQVESTALTFAASINPKGAATTAYFEYGPTPAFGSQTAAFTVPTGATPSFHTRTVSGLAENTTYYYRAVAMNAGGTTFGNTKSARTGQTPVVTAVDDQAYTVARRIARIDVLANDFGVARSALRVTAVSKPLAGAVMLNADGSITYFPGAAFKDSDTFSYTVQSTSGSSDTAMVTVTNRFDAGAGLYNGLIGDASTPYAESGAITIRVAELGTFTGSMHFGGTMHRVAGVLTPEGQVTMSVPISSGGLLSLTFTVEPDLGILSGMVQRGKSLATFTSKRVEYTAKENPAPQEGRYTMLLQHTSPEGSENAGIGSATMTVNKAGLVRVSGRNPLGEPFVARAGYINPDGEYPFYAVPTAERASSLQGMIKFISRPNVSDFEGVLGEATPRLGNVQAENKQIAVLGSLFVAPDAGQLLLSWQPRAGNGAFAAGAATSSPLLDSAVTLSDKHRLTTSGAKGLSFRVNAGTGVITGTASLPVKGKPRATTLRGVVFQIQGRAMGYWKSGPQMGWLEICDSERQTEEAE